MLWKSCRCWWRRARWRGESTRRRIWSSSRAPSTLTPPPGARSPPLAAAACAPPGGKRGAHAAGRPSTLQAAGSSKLAVGLPLRWDPRTSTKAKTETRSLSRARLPHDARGMMPSLCAMGSTAPVHPEGCWESPTRTAYQHQRVCPSALARARSRRPQRHPTRVARRMKLVCGFAPTLRRTISPRALRGASRATVAPRAALC